MIDHNTSGLMELVGNLSSGEQDTIAKVIVRAQQHNLSPLDAIGVIHSALLADQEDADAVADAELSAADAPAVIDDYHGCTRVALPREPIAIESTLDAVIQARSSCRDYSHRELTLDELGTLLFRSYGIKRYIRAYHKRVFPLRYAPSQGGLQCMEMYVVVNRVAGVEKGLYAYSAADPSLALISAGNHSQKLKSSCVGQDYVQHAAIVLILAIDLARLTWKYGARSYRFAHADAGVIAAFIYLVATGLGLGTTAIAAFDDTAVNALIRVDGRERFAALVMPVGAIANCGGYHG
jgi:SagB-type dehydrogenase family enzyme